MRQRIKQIHPTAFLLEMLPIPEEFKRYQDRPNNPGPDDYNFKANPSLEINDLPPWECP